MRDPAIFFGSGSPDRLFWTEGLRVCRGGLSFGAVALALFDKFKRADLRVLQEFAARHQDVEAYMEPETSIRPQSLLLVARDGEWARATVADRGQAGAFCRRLGIPYYDAAVVGYPERMKGTKGRPAPEAPSAEELEAWFAGGTAPDPGESG